MKKKVPGTGLTVQEILKIAARVTGQRGGRARAAKLSPERRRQIASLGGKAAAKAKAQWRKTRGTQ